ncbi:CRP-like cAMP-binding protein [Mucilaginibacter yixingensis]|uniref:CRP-like cAMP-binding protein n=1 Tax=Mucilaginibacter yixingensis TaxID=1295612 RepID=A0A2T5JBH2_9SPHI|nr:response regulator [Mucilaginibacter yixingensis]PTQ98214.1 CRP-like cAMP-binding protein [Mucilaginibacter yixingensis]
MKTILIIEDNTDIRESTAEILTLADYRVLEADNGRTGVDLATQHKPDLILCDIMMPELDGYGVLYLLSKNTDTMNIPFIFLTAKAERVDFRKGMEMGADDYLTKPFDDLELLNAIESRLAKKQRQEEFYSKSLQNLEQLAAGQGKGAAELKNLIAGRKIRQIKKKQVLFYEGDMPQGLYLLMEGAVRTYKMAEDGRELMMNLYRADDYLGIHALLLDEPYTETAEALEDCAICLLPKDAVIGLMDRYPDVSGQFIRLLANNIKDKEEQLLELAYNSVRKRLAQTLVRLSNQLPSPDQFRISRDELAAMAGMATETVSRTLSDFKDEKLIEKKGSTISILDLQRLARMKN